MNLRPSWLLCESLSCYFPSRKKRCLWMIGESVYSGLGPGVSWASGLGSCVWVCGVTFVWGWVCLDKYTEREKYKARGSQDLTVQLTVRNPFKDCAPLTQLQGHVTLPHCLSG